jgi:DNA repair photolyase
VSVAPSIPFINAPGTERILEAARCAGAVGAHYTVGRMPWEVNPLFQQCVYAYFADHAQRVLNCMKDMHGGMEYHSDFKKRMSGEGV